MIENIKAGERITQAVLLRLQKVGNSSNGGVFRINSAVAGQNLKKMASPFHTKRFSEPKEIAKSISTLIFPPNIRTKRLTG